MTRKEAIASYEKLYAYMVGDDDAIELDYGEFMELNNYIRSALLPVWREQVEKVWRGKWVPAESDFDDDDTLFDVEDWCDWQCSACHNEICYDDPMERKWLPKFCPACGAPMTDEAVDMVMERMEALKDGKGD